MNEASRLLDGDLTADELSTLLDRLKHDTQFRDELATQQLISDSLHGMRALDAGYSLGILARLRQVQAQAQADK